MPNATTYTVHVPEDKARLRLDRFLAGALPALSRTRLKALIEAGRVSRSGAAATDPAAPVRPGEAYAVRVPAPRPARPRPEPIPISVVYEDGDLLVVDKPAGLVVHPAAGNPDGTLVNALLHHCRDGLSGIGGVTRPGIVHRLDKGTSGLMVVAKTDAAHRHLAGQLEARKLARAYQAMVWGAPRPARGTVEGLIGRNPRNRKKMAVVARGGKPAVTRYRTLKRLGGVSLVECRLETGRTHQIRVHLASLGCPVVGDPLYGGGPRRGRKDAPQGLRQWLGALDHQLLHAYLIAFEHPASGESLLFESSIPKEFNELTAFLEEI